MTCPSPARADNTLPFTLASTVGFGVGTRSIHGSFGLSAAYQTLTPPRGNGERRFIAYGASAFVRAYAPAGQIGCGRDIEGSPRVCPTSASAGPTLRVGTVSDRKATFVVPDKRLELAVTPFVGSEPLRAPSRSGLALGARISASGTFVSAFEKTMEGNPPSGRESAFLLLFSLPLLVLNRVEGYIEPMTVGGKAYVTFGLATGFGF